LFVSVCVIIIAEVFLIDDYYANRSEVFRSLIEFSKRPEASSARETVRQIVELASSESSEAGNEFLRVYNDCQRR